MRVLLGIVAITAMCDAPFAACRAAEVTSLKHGVFLLHDEERLAGKETYDI